MAGTFKIDHEHLKPVPVGNSGWEDFSQKCYTFDKTIDIQLVAVFGGSGEDVQIFRR